MVKPDYNREMEWRMAEIPLGSSLLLHSCCGPCSTAVLERLGERFSVTLYFYNPNIDSETEYQRRLEAQRRVAEELRVRYPVQLIAAPYDPAPFAAVAEGFGAESEGGARCDRCFALRLEETAKLAKVQGFEYFTTTLSVSPRKDAGRLNEIGAALGEAYGVPYLVADFKKKGGYQRSVELAAALQLYRQGYCGCGFSVGAAL